LAPKGFYYDKSLVGLNYDKRGLIMIRAWWGLAKRAPLEMHGTMVFEWGPKK
jgi:hypothetical protein